MWSEFISISIDLVFIFYYCFQPVFISSITLLCWGPYLLGSLLVLALGNLQVTLPCAGVYSHSGPQGCMDWFYRVAWKSVLTSHSEVPIYSGYVPFHSMDLFDNSLPRIVRLQGCESAGTHFEDMKSYLIANYLSHMKKC